MGNSQEVEHLKVEKREEVYNVDLAIGALITERIHIPLNQYR